METSKRSKSGKDRDRYTADLEDLRSQFKVFVEVLEIIRQQLDETHEGLRETIQLLKNTSQPSRKA